MPPRTSSGTFRARAGAPPDARPAVAGGRRVWYARALPPAAGLPAAVSHSHGLPHAYRNPQAIFLKDYIPPAWWVDTVELHVAIHDDHAEVRARLACRRNPANPQQDMVLDGEELTLLEVGADGTAIAPSRYTVGDENLTIHGPCPTASRWKPGCASSPTKTPSSPASTNPRTATSPSAKPRASAALRSFPTAPTSWRATAAPSRPTVRASRNCFPTATRSRQANSMAAAQAGIGPSGKTPSPSPATCSRL
jgi:hypothetical protein